MQPPIPKLVCVTVLGGLILVLTGGLVPAHQPLPLLCRISTQPEGANQSDDPQLPEGIEVLARGPVHEAFATTTEPPREPPVVPQQPPEPIEELPPDQKPDGENVQWLPGYWHWDDDANQFIWISGFWRAVPPGRIWVPGAWRHVRDGWQWVPGFWQEPQPQQPQQPQIEYLPQPPDSIEAGPSVPAPTATSFYVPGTWVWRSRFVWRPGFWIEYRPNWIWVPAHWRWTPVGYVFVEGYWDYPLGSRGILYAPVAFTRPIYTRPTFVYTPAYVVSEPCMLGALFVRRGWGCYYFGDYFAPRYTTIGFSAWCGTVGSGGAFSIGFGVGRTWGYDPLWTYYSVTYRTTPGWSVGVAGLYGGRFAGTLPRPPVTLVQQNTLINNITKVNVTNVTNNITVVNKNVRVNNTNVTDVAMLAPARAARDLQPEARVQLISAQTRQEQAKTAQQLRELAAQRNALEAKVKPVGKTTDPPQLVKLDVPKTIVAKAQVKDETKAPPPNPNRDFKAATRVDPKANEFKPEPPPIFTPRNVKPESRNEPKAEPKNKADPRSQTKLPPKNEPKSITIPKIDPKDPPKKIAQPIEAPRPKVDPKDPPKKIAQPIEAPRPTGVRPPPQPGQQKPGALVPPSVQDGSTKPPTINPPRVKDSPPPMGESQPKATGGKVEPKADSATPQRGQQQKLPPPVIPPPLAGRPKPAIQPFDPLSQLRSATKETQPPISRPNPDVKSNPAPMSLIRPQPNSKLQVPPGRQEPSPKDRKPVPPPQ